MIVLMPVRNADRDVKKHRANRFCFMIVFMDIKCS